MEEEKKNEEKECDAATKRKVAVRNTVGIIIIIAIIVVGLIFALTMLRRNIQQATTAESNVMEKSIEP